MDLKVKPYGYVKYTGGLTFHQVKGFPRTDRKTFRKSRWTPVHYEEDYEWMKESDFNHVYEFSKKQPKEKETEPESDEKKSVTQKVKDKLGG